MTQAIVKGVEELRAIHQQKPVQIAKAKEVVNRLKLQLAEQGFLTGSGNAATAQLACSMLEYACLIAIEARDVPFFERNFAQLKPYYIDYKLDSGNKPLLFGLNLLRLLSQNLISEFHTELELIPELHDNLYIKHPVQIEQYIMEGSFTKVWDARQDVPQAHYGYFMDLLMDTIRKQIAATTEVAYESLPVAHAQKLFLLNSQSALADFVKQNSTWMLQDGRIQFNMPQDNKDLVSATDLIKQSIAYARDLEAIV